MARVHYAGGNSDGERGRSHVLIAPLFNSMESLARAGRYGIQRRVDSWGAQEHGEHQE